MADEYTHFISELSQLGAVSREALLADGAKLKDKVILITGGASGIGKDFGLEAARFGAKLAICNTTPKTGTAAAKAMEAAGSPKTLSVSPIDVQDWDQQLRFFKETVAAFGKIDIVVVNAGITEVGDFGDFAGLSALGDPKPPNFKTFQTNTVGALYTTRLALHYLRENSAKDKSIVLVGSMASFFGIPAAPMYTTSKHAMLGMMRSLVYQCKSEGIPLNMVAPWFTDTNIIDIPTRSGLAGLPLCEMADCTAAMVKLATDKTMYGHSLVIDARGIFNIPPESTLVGKSSYYYEFSRRAAFSIQLTVLARDSLLFARHLVKRTIGI